MKRFIAGLVAGIVLATASVGVAASGYWAQDGRDYSCEGTGSGVICTSGGYKVGVTKSFVFVKKGSHVYGCQKWTSWSGCFD